MHRLLAALLVAALALAACAGDDDTATDEAVDATPSEDLERKPEVTLPDSPPSELVVDDLVEGDGAVAEIGSTLTVDYTGVSLSDGTEFDSSWEREPFQFTLGDGEVIAGWDQGLAGMRTGGRRRLVVPPDLAYGDNPPRGIEPGETLVFVVDLREVS